MPCDPCPSTAVISAIRVRLCRFRNGAARLSLGLGCRARGRHRLAALIQRDGSVPAQKDLQPDFDARHALAKILLAPGQGIHLATQPRIQRPDHLPVQSGQRSADREDAYQLWTQFPFAPCAGYRRICRDLTPNDNSIQQERRKSRRAFRILPTTLARRPYAGMRQVGETNQCETWVGGGRGVCGEGSGSQVLARIRGAARYGRRAKESPFPSIPKGRGGVYRAGKEGSPSGDPSNTTLFAAADIRVVDQAVIRPDQHLDRDTAA